LATPHSGAVMHYTRYIEPQDGAMSILPCPNKKQLHEYGVFRKKVKVLAMGKQSSSKN
jgi:ssDNA-specific exonuclease RecJ